MIAAQRGRAEELMKENDIRPTPGVNSLEQSEEDETNAKNRA